MRKPGDRRTIGRGVCRDDGRNRMSGNGTRRLGQIIRTEIGRQLHGQRNTLAVSVRQAFALRGQGRKQRIKRGCRLQIAQPCRIRRRNIHRDIVGHAVNRPHGRKVVLRRSLRGRGRILADIHPDNPAEFPPCEAIGRGLRPFVVESHAVDQRPRGRQAEEARTRITGLRARGNRPHLDAPESQPAPRIDMPRILVHTGGQTHTVGKTQPHDLDRRAAGRRTEQTRAPSRLEPGQSRRMGHLRGQGEENRPQDPVNRHPSAIEYPGR